MNFARKERFVLWESSCFKLFGDGKYGILLVQKVGEGLYSRISFHDIPGLGKYGFSCSVIIVSIIFIITIVNIITLLLSQSSLLLFLVLSMLFTLFYFILFFYCSYYYDFCFLVCVMCMYPFVDYFFFLLLMIYILYSHCSYMSRIIFLQSLLFISSSSSSLSFQFFQHYQSLGQNSANEFEQHGLPLPIDYFG